MCELRRTPTSETDPEEMLRLLRDPSWVIRRKESLELLNDRLVRHRVSVDFRCEASQQTVPLFLLRKATGQFTCFDFKDESGRSMPLPTRQENVALSSAILTTAAREVLKPHDLDLTPRLEAELQFIAEGESDVALDVLKYFWPSQRHARKWLDLLSKHQRPDLLRPPGPDEVSQYAWNKTLLMADDFFHWLVRTLAYSSVVAVNVEAGEGERRVLKLAYDEDVVNLVRPRAAGLRANVAHMVGYVFYRLGWRGYPVNVFVPYAGANTFHVELHAPEGTEILEALIREHDWTRVRGRRTRVHLYLGDASSARSLAADVQLRVRGVGFIGAAVAASLAITAAVTACWLGADELAKHQSLGGAPSLLLVFPGLAATYLTRTEHPLVARLLRFARFALFAAAIVAYVAAARLALADKSTSSDELTACFFPLSVVAAVISVSLLLTSVLPLPLSHWARRPFRWLARTRRRAAAPSP